MNAWRLYMLAERRGEDGQWQAMGTWYHRAGLARPGEWLYPPDESAYKPALFAALSGNRTGPGVPECAPVSSAEGLPDDASVEVRGYVASRDAQFVSWLGLDTLLAYPWRVSVVRRASLSLEGAHHFYKTGIFPRKDPGNAASPRVDVEDALTPQELWGVDWLERTLTWARAFAGQDVRLALFFERV